MNTDAAPSPQSSDIKSILGEFAASGQSVGAFARSRGLAVWRLRYALARRDGKRPTQAKRSTAPVLIPVRVVEGKSNPSSSLELLLVGGHRVRIEADFDAELLRRVVKALASC